MISLDMLKPTRLAKQFRRAHLASLVDIPEARLRELELRLSEPWFDEACLLSRALCVDGIIPLISSDDLTLSKLASPLPTDLDMWRSGARPPLSLAIRIAARFGLTDPCELSVTPLQRQLWAVLEASERNPEAPGYCPWCAAHVLQGEPHLPTCLPSNLWTPPAVLEPGSKLPQAILRPRKRVQRSKGICAYGIRALREAREMRQVDVAALLGLNPNYYARLERGDLPLTVELADALAEAWEVDRALLYARPVPE